MPWFRRQPSQLPEPTHPTAPQPVPQHHQEFTPYIPPPLALLNVKTSENRPALQELLQTAAFTRSTASMKIGLGVSPDGPVILNLSQAEHLLIAGAPPAMRDAMIHSILLSLLFYSDPNALKLLLFEGDPNTATLSIYHPVPHLIAPIVTDPNKMVGALRWTIQEMNRRQRLYAEIAVNCLTDYNQNASERLPSLLVVCNEVVPIIHKLSEFGMTDLIDSLTTLIQHGSQYGIHLLITTQLPETSTLTDLFPLALKHHIPTKILWAGSWIDNSQENPWMLQVVKDRSLAPFQGAWVGPRAAARVADYFAPSGSVTVGTLADLDALSGIEFEETIQTILHEQGWQLDLTAVTGDFGADLIGRGADGAMWVIQAKRWKGSVGIEAVQQVLGAQAYYQSQRALLVTTAPLTKAALELAARTHVTIWTREDVIPLFTTLREQSIATHRLYSSHTREVTGTKVLDFAPDELERADPLFWDAVRDVVESGQASTSFVQRHLRIGYTRAAQIIDTMESCGYIGPSDGFHQREIYLKAADLQQLANGHLDRS